MMCVAVQVRILAVLYMLPIYNAQSGSVEYVGYDANGYGNYIKVVSSGKTAYYAHLSDIDDRIRRNAFVAKGQYLGKSGNTGRSTGPHLHFHVKQGSSPILLTGMRGFSATTYPTTSIGTCGYMQSP